MVAGQIENFNLRLYSVGSCPIHAPQERDPLSVLRPNRRTEEVAGLACEFSGLLSIRPHQPQFLALRGSFQKRNLCAVRRDRRFPTLVGQLARTSPRAEICHKPGSCDDPATEVTRMCDPSGNQLTGLRPESLRQSQGMSFTGIDLAQVESGVVGKCQVLAIA